jgi:hypothetical protein
MRVFGSKFAGWCVLTVIAIILAIAVGNVIARSEPANVKPGIAACQPLGSGMSLLAQVAEQSHADLMALQDDKLERFLIYLDGRGLRLPRDHTQGAVLLRFADGHVEFAIVDQTQMAVCAAPEFVIPASSIGDMLRAINGIDA